jgi:hypothetical protein
MAARALFASADRVDGVMSRDRARYPLNFDSSDPPRDDVLARRRRAGGERSAVDSSEAVPTGVFSGRCGRTRCRELDPTDRRRLHRLARRRPGNGRVKIVLDTADGRRGRRSPAPAEPSRFPQADLDSNCAHGDPGSHFVVVGFC